MDQCEDCDHKTDLYLSSSTYGLDGYLCPSCVDRRLNLSVRQPVDNGGEGVIITGPLPDEPVARYRAVSAAARQAEAISVKVRRETVRRLWIDGASWTDVGRKLGISAQRARAIADPEHWTHWRALRDREAGGR